MAAFLGAHNEPLLSWRLLGPLVFGLLPIFLWFRLSNAKRSQLKGGRSENSNDAAATDPSLLKKHSKSASYHVPKTGFTYRSIRIFFRPHPQAEKLPSKPLPLPLIVFVHGLGGSAAQFSPLLTSIVNCGPCLCIDLPGCGLSEFAPQEWEAYTVEALVQLLAVVIESYRDVDNGQGIVFIGHSLGCSLAARLASKSGDNTTPIPERTVGLIALCPRVSGLSETQATQFKRLLHIPTPIFNIMRLLDRRGGEESHSVHRFAGIDAEPETKKLQLRFNEQSKTAVWRRMAYGVLPTSNSAQDCSSTKGGLPNEDIWAGLNIPVFLIAGEADKVTPPEEVNKIADILKKSWNFTNEASTLKADDTAAHAAINDTISILKPYRCVKVTILPPPASHALFYAPATCRIISGLIQSFLADHVDKRLSLGWQLQHLSTEGKWDVKNAAKWEKIQAVSEPIGGLFRAMKTMREVDDRHCPKVFRKEWADNICCVVDISHESPVYDPAGLESSTAETKDLPAIQYHKFPTVSKLPPAHEEVSTFISLINRLRSEEEQNQLRNQRSKVQSQNPSIETRTQTTPQKLIAVHCHYGFNRTGFFLVSYLVEQLGWPLQAAIDEFASKRAPGIKHDYFVDTLFVRYGNGNINDEQTGAMNMKRRGTIFG